MTSWAARSLTPSSRRRLLMHRPTAEKPDPCCLVPSSCSLTFGLKYRRVRASIRRHLPEPLSILHRALDSAAELQRRREVVFEGIPHVLSCLVIRDRDDDASRLVENSTSLASDHGPIVILGRGRHLPPSVRPDPHVCHRHVIRSLLRLEGKPPAPASGTVHPAAGEVRLRHEEVEHTLGIALEVHVENRVERPCARHALVRKS